MWTPTYVEWLVLMGRGICCMEGGEMFQGNVTQWNVWNPSLQGSMWWSPWPLGKRTKHGRKTLLCILVSTEVRWAKNSLGNLIKVSRAPMCQTVPLPVAWTLGPSFVKKPLRWDKTMPSEQMLIACEAHWGRGDSTLEDGLGRGFGRPCAAGLG